MDDSFVDIVAGDSHNVAQQDPEDTGGNQVAKTVGFTRGKPGETANLGDYVELCIDNHNKETIKLPTGPRDSTFWQIQQEHVDRKMRLKNAQGES